MSQPLTQRTFIRGVDASTSKLDQPKGSLPRLINLIMTRRGSLVTVDGSVRTQVAPSAGNGEIIAAIEYLGSNPAIVGTFIGQPIIYLQDPKPNASELLAEVTGLSAVAAAAGGTLAGTYDVVVQVNDGRSPLGTEISFGSSNGVTVAGIVVGGADNAITVTWNIRPGAASYSLWLVKAGTPQSIDGTNRPLAIVYQPDYNQPYAGGTVSYTIKAEGINAIGWNFGVGNFTLGALKLMIMFPNSAGGYTAPYLLALFPCRNTVPRLLLNSGGGSSPTASGGVLGATCPVPHLIQFAGFVIIGLGNGLRPQYTDGAATKPLSNTFTAQYINWAAAVTYLVDDIVQPAPADGHLYICVQGGLSGGAQPAFNTGVGQRTIDNQVLWQENGQVTTSPPPRGGAHLTYHAGALWIMDTSPTNSSDLLDGPSAIAMSDVDNINSWNPLNRAFIGKDDGSDGMGLTPLTISEVGIAPLGSLIAFKDFSIYQIIGVFGAPDFAIQQLQTDMGCLAPRSIKFLSGYGVIRMSHAGFALTDGVRDRLISESIRPFIFGSPATGSPGLPSITGIDLANVRLMKADLVNNPPMYAAAAPLIGSNKALSRIFLYDLILKAWAIIDLPVTAAPSSFISSIYQMRGGEGIPRTIVGGYDSGSIQIIQNGNSTWDLNGVAAPVAWAFTSPEVVNSQDPTSAVYVDTLTLRGINTDGKQITVSINLQTEAGFIAAGSTYPIGPGEFELRIGIAEIALSCNALISGSGRVEIESLTWDVQPQPAGVPSVIS